ncbi:hypothetical protein ABAC402_04930 [Asticcacaulis sp. AC402]|nr:hypothetical protein ABAC402_04930 [Asticcacaulis sp. AC402]
MIFLTILVGFKRTFCRVAILAYPMESKHDANEELW